MLMPPVVGYGYFLESPIAIVIVIVIVIVIIIIIITTNMLSLSLSLSLLYSFCKIPQAFNNIMLVEFTLTALAKESTKSTM